MSWWKPGSDDFEINSSRDAEEHWLTGKLSKRDERRSRKHAEEAGDEFGDWLSGF